MYPYPYAAYPTAAPVSYAPPMAYQQPPMSYMTPAYDPYAAVPTAVQPVGYAPPTNIQRQQVDRRQFQNPPAAGYYPYGTYPAAPTNPNLRGRAPAKPSVSDRRQKLLNDLSKDSNIDALFKQKGTTVNVSKVYHVRKPKRGFQDDFDDEFQSVAIEPPRPVAQMQPAMPMPIQRMPSAVSTYSDCSECNRKNCPDCRSPDGGHNCPDCNTEWKHGRNQMRRDNWN